MINLANYLYDTVRIEVMVSDCEYNAHFGYAYVAGECRPMTINTAGCPPGMSTDVVTLAAPRGMRTYQWAASNMGVAEPVTSVNPGASNSWFTFRDLTTPLSEAGGASYKAQASDFAVRYRPNAEHQMIAISDSMGQDQTFRCRMTSALDTAKPFTSDLFVNVRNTKPTMKIDSLSFCDGNVRLWNRSYVPGATGLVVDSVTRWSFYSNVDCNPNSLIDTAIGDSCTYHFPDTNYYGVIARTFTIDSSCYSEGMYVVKPMVNPIPRISISSHVISSDMEVTITDLTENVQYREWRFLSELVDGAYDTVPNEQSVTRAFTHAVEPIELYVQNGLFYVNPYDATDTVMCSASCHDTIHIITGDIDGPEALNVKVYPSNGQIVVEGAEGNTVTLYDVNGRMLATKRDNYTLLRFDVPASGTYMIKIGNYPARNVVVIR